MNVLLNGDRREVAEASTVADAVELAGGEPGERGVAVAVDGEVVSRGEWETTHLSEGQAVEVVRAVQGG